MRRRPQVSNQTDVDPERFRTSDAVGDCPWFGASAPGHATASAAREQWQRCRREVWARCYLFWLPKAAEVYDGLSRESIDVIRSVVQYRPEAIDVASIRLALRRDRKRLERFAANDPGARQIADYLEQFGACLDVVERLIDALQVDPVATRGTIWGTTSSSRLYDGTERGRTDAA